MTEAVMINLISHSHDLFRYCTWFQNWLYIIHSGFVCIVGMVFSYP